MENRDVKMVSMGLMILSLVLQKDYVSQTQLNVFTKEIVAKHRDKTINGMYGNLAKNFSDALKVGPDKFIDLVHVELTKIDCVDSVSALSNKCTLITYVLITEIKMVARFGICQSVSNRVYNAYVSAVQSLDGLI